MDVDGSGSSLADAKRGKRGARNLTATSAHLPASRPAVDSPRRAKEGRQSTMHKINTYSLR